MAKQNSDFRPEEYLRRFAPLEEFKKEFEGGNFYKKIAEAVTESTSVQKCIGDVMWDKFKSKMAILIIGACGAILIGFMSRLPDILIAWGRSHNAAASSSQPTLPPQANSQSSSSK